MALVQVVELEVQVLHHLSQVHLLLMLVVAVVVLVMLVVAMVLLAELVVLAVAVLA
jgi:hypothetical protein